jgi:hypothetical protein
MHSALHAAVCTTRSVTRDPELARVRSHLQHWHFLPEDLQVGYSPRRNPTLFSRLSSPASLHPSYLRLVPGTGIKGEEEKHHVSQKRCPDGFFPPFCPTLNHVSIPVSLPSSLPCHSTSERSRDSLLGSFTLTAVSPGRPPAAGPSGGVALATRGGQQVRVGLGEL